MKAIKNIHISIGYMLTILVVLVVSMSCERKEIPIETTDDVLMGKYVEENPDLSEFLRLAALTNNLGFINAYGSYTFFIPSNEAFSVYLQEKGKGSLEEFSEEELDELFNYHIVNDTLSSIYFTDGKLKSPSMNGKYLITGVSVNNEGRANYVVNKTSIISNLDVFVGNGVIHQLDQVLDPPTLTVAEMITNNPDFSIFAKALEETKVYDIINNPNDLYTVLVQSDAVYNDMGINSYEDLKNEYSDLGEATNPLDSLNLYMQYHCLPGANYVADIVLANSHLTLVPQEVITVTVDGDLVLINDQTVAGTYYPGAELDRTKNDNSASNGVYHELIGKDGHPGNIYIKILLPVSVYWDPTAQPEITKLSGIYKDKIVDVYFNQGELANVEWGGNNSQIGYHGDGYAVQSDVLEIYLRTTVVPWAELKTPLLIKGKYKLWVTWRTENYPTIIQTTFDDQILDELLFTNYYAKKPNAISEDDYEAIGYRFHRYNSTDNRNPCKLLGIIDVESTGQHTIRFDALTNARGHLWLDMVHFIPVDQDQRWPKFESDGTLVYPSDTVTVVEPIVEL